MADCPGVSSDQGQLCPDRVDSAILLDQSSLHGSIDDGKCDSPLNVAEECIQSFLHQGVFNTLEDNTPERNPLISANNTNPTSLPSSDIEHQNKTCSAEETINSLLEMNNIIPDTSDDRLSITADDEAGYQSQSKNIDIELEVPCSHVSGLESTMQNKCLSVENADDRLSITYDEGGDQTDVKGSELKSSDVVVEGSASKPEDTINSSQSEVKKESPDGAMSDKKKKKHKHHKKHSKKKKKKHKKEKKKKEKELKSSEVGKSDEPSNAQQSSSDESDDQRKHKSPIHLSSVVVQPSKHRNDASKRSPGVSLVSFHTRKKSKSDDAVKGKVTSISAACASAIPVEGEDDYDDDWLTYRSEAKAAQMKKPSKRNSQSLEEKRETDYDSRHKHITSKERKKSDGSFDSHNERKRESHYERRRSDSMEIKAIRRDSREERYKHHHNEIRKSISIDMGVKETPRRRSGERRDSQEERETKREQKQITSAEMKEKETKRRKNIDRRDSHEQDKDSRRELISLGDKEEAATRRNNSSVETRNKEDRRKTLNRKDSMEENQTDLKKQHCTSTEMKDQEKRSASRDSHEGQSKEDEISKSNAVQTTDEGNKRIGITGSKSLEEIEMKTKMSASVEKREKWKRRRIIRIVPRELKDKQTELKKSATADSKNKGEEQEGGKSINRRDSHEKENEAEISKISLIEVSKKEEQQSRRDGGRRDLSDEMKKDKSESSPSHGAGSRKDEQETLQSIRGKNSHEKKENEVDVRRSTSVEAEHKKEVQERRKRTSRKDSREGKGKEAEASRVEMKNKEQKQERRKSISRKDSREEQETEKEPEESQGISITGMKKGKWRAFGSSGQPEKGNDEIRKQDKKQSNSIDMFEPDKERKGINLIHSREERKVGKEDQMKESSYTGEEKSKRKEEKGTSEKGRDKEVDLGKKYRSPSEKDSKTGKQNQRSSRRSRSTSVHRDSSRSPSLTTSRPQSRSKTSKGIVSSSDSSSDDSPSRKAQSKTPKRKEKKRHRKRRSRSKTPSKKRKYKSRSRSPKREVISKVTPRRYRSRSDSPKDVRKHRKRSRSRSPYKRKIRVPQSFLRLTSYSLSSSSSSSSRSPSPVVEKPSKRKYSSKRSPQRKVKTSSRSRSRSNTSPFKEKYSRRKSSDKRSPSRKSNKFSAVSRGRSRSESPSQDKTLAHTSRDKKSPPRKSSYSKTLSRSRSRSSSPKDKSSRRKITDKFLKRKSRKLSTANDDQTGKSVSPSTKKTRQKDVRSMSSETVLSSSTQKTSVDKEQLNQQSVNASSSVDEDRKKEICAVPNASPLKTTTGIPSQNALSSEEHLKGYLDGLPKDNKSSTTKTRSLSPKTISPRKRPREYLDMISADTLVDGVESKTDSNAMFLKPEEKVLELSTGNIRKDVQQEHYETSVKDVKTVDAAPLSSEAPVTSNITQAPGFTEEKSTTSLKIQPTKDIDIIKDYNTCDSTLNVTSAVTMTPQSLTKKTGVDNNDNMARQDSQTISPKRGTRKDIPVIKDISGWIAKGTLGSVVKDLPESVSKDTPILVAKDKMSTVSKEIIGSVTKETPTPVIKESPVPVTKEIQAPVSKETQALVVKEPQAPITKEIPPLIVKETPITATEVARDSKTLRDSQIEQTMPQQTSQSVNANYDHLPPPPAPPLPLHFHNVFNPIGHLNPNMQSGPSGTGFSPRLPLVQPHLGNTLQFQSNMDHLPQHQAETPSFMSSSQFVNIPGSSEGLLPANELCLTSFNMQQQNRTLLGLPTSASVIPFLGDNEPKATNGSSDEIMDSAAAESPIDMEMSGSSPEPEVDIIEKMNEEFWKTEQSALDEAYEPEMIPDDPVFPVESVQVHVSSSTKKKAKKIKKKRQKPSEPKEQEEPKTKVQVLLDKLHRQARVEEEVKIVLKEYYKHREIDKTEYKSILRKAVPQVANSNHSIDPERIRSLVKKYVAKTKGARLQTKA